MAFEGVIPRPTYPTAAQATRVIQTTYEGAVFNLLTAVTVSSVLFRFTAVTTPVTISFAVYQRQNQSATSFTLAFSGSFTPGAGGAQNASVAVGPFGLAAGEIVIIFGRSSAGGTATMRTYGTQAADGLNANVQAGAFPTTFTTATAASGGPPTTINPAAETVSALDLGMLVRFL